MVPVLNRLVSLQELVSRFDHVPYYCVCVRVWNWGISEFIAVLIGESWLTSESEFFSFFGYPKTIQIHIKYKKLSPSNIKDSWMFLGISDPVSEIPHRGRVSHPKTQDVQNWEALVDPKVDLPPWNRQWLGKIWKNWWETMGCCVFSQSGKLQFLLVFLWVVSDG